MKSPQLPLDAPFNESQRAWLSGFFAGMHAHINQSAGLENQTDSRVINILYGSQTGNAESVANDAANIAKTYGLKPLVKSMDEIEADALTTMDCLLIITSTYGEGEMPDNAQMLWDGICAETMPRLEGMTFSVLALGDTSYDLFCQAGIDWDNKLAELGANRVYDRSDCDVDFEEPVEQWMTAVIPLMAGGAATTVVEADSQTTGKPEYHRKNPFPAKLLVNRLLTDALSSKETRHYEISIAGSGLTYEAGDALCVAPTNCPALVADIIKAIGCKGDEDEPVNGELMPLQEALRTHFEIKMPSKELIEEIATRSGDQELNGILNRAIKKSWLIFMGPRYAGFIVAIPRLRICRCRIYSLIKTFATSRLFDFLQWKTVSG